MFSTCLSLFRNAGSVCTSVAMQLASMVSRAACRSEGRSDITMRPGGSGGCCREADCETLEGYDDYR